MVTINSAAFCYWSADTIIFLNISAFQAQINQCETVLNTENINEIFLHCVGNAISRGINLALTLIANSNNGLGYEANTSVIELIGLFVKLYGEYCGNNAALNFVTDDFHPLHDDEDFTLQKRLNSCLHIRVYRHSKNIVSK